MLGQVLFYKGLHKVKVVTESEGYWIVEALEAFEDFLDGKKITVAIGERRIVQPSELHKRKVLSPPVPEHVYERSLEKKVKRMVEKSDKKAELHSP
ncbi:MAG: hypothetical protein ACM3JE_03140 [Betaproteobacteria bacterium]